MLEKKELEKKLNKYRIEHRELDKKINHMIELGSYQIDIQRLKKKKLWLKDQIAIIEDQLIPDIIA